MQKRTLFLVVAVLGVLTLISSGRMRQFSMSGGMGNFMGVTPVEPMANTYDADFSEKMMVDSGVAADRSLIMPYPGVGGDALSVEDRAVEYSASHQLVVQDVQSYLEDFRSYVQSVGGQVLYLNQGKDPLQLYRYGSLTAKVPVNSFEAALSKITAGVKDIISENQNMADITGQKVYSSEEVTRIQGEISVREAELAEATTQSVRVRIQNQLTELRRQLLEAQRGSDQIDERTEFATLSVTVADSERYYGGRHQPSPSEDLREALRSVWTSVASLVRMAIWVTVYAVIWLPVVGVGSVVYSRLRRK